MGHIATGTQDAIAASGTHPVVGPNVDGSRQNIYARQLAEIELSFFYACSRETIGHPARKAMVEETAVDHASTATPHQHARPERWGRDLAELHATTSLSIGDEGYRTSVGPHSSGGKSGLYPNAEPHRFTIEGQWIPWWDPIPAPGSTTPYTGPDGLSPAAMVRRIKRAYDRFGRESAERVYKKVASDIGSLDREDWNNRLEEERRALEAGYPDVI